MSYPQGNPQYPAPPNHLYPQLDSFGQPMAYPQPQFAPQPGFAYPYPNQSGQIPPGQPGAHPMAMSYPVGIAPTAPLAHNVPTGYPGPQVAVAAPLIEWVKTTPREAGALGEKAVIAGFDCDGSPLWVIRARFDGDLIPGKLAIKHGAAYVPWGGKENSVQDIEVCCARPGAVQWVASADGVVPAGAVAAGATAGGEPLYVARAKHQGSLTPGKVHVSHKSMYISFGGHEVAQKNYEVMVAVHAAPLAPHQIPRGVDWIPTTPAEAHLLSDRAIVAGFEAHDGSPLWVIRSNHQGQMIPGKLAVKHRTAYIPFGGLEQKVDHIEVLCANPSEVRWVAAGGGCLPPRALPGGAAGGETLYVGRASQQGALTPGKVQPSHQALYLSFAGKEHKHQSYEVLCAV